MQFIGHHRIPIGIVWPSGSSWTHCSGLLSFSWIILFSFSRFLTPLHPSNHHYLCIATFLFWVGRWGPLGQFCLWYFVVCWIELASDWDRQRFPPDSCLQIRFLILPKWWRVYIWIPMIGGFGLIYFHEFTSIFFGFPQLLLIPLNSLKFFRCFLFIHYNYLYKGLRTSILQILYQSTSINHFLSVCPRSSWISSNLLKYLILSSMLYLSSISFWYEL